MVDRDPAEGGGGPSQRLIWLVGETPRESWAGRRRLAGMRARLRSAGLTIARHVECVWWPEIAREAVLDALRDQPMATAIFALNDRVAMGIYQAAAAHGRTISDGLSVISFDNSDLARWLDPGLSSIALPRFDLGRRAVEILLDGRTASGTHTVPMPLNARRSIAPPLEYARNSTAAELRTASP